MSDEKQDERRKHLRARTHGRVWADPGGFALPIDCKVEDVSATGAKIQPIGGELPDTFVLHLPAYPKGIEATVVWREKHSVGVKWTKS